MLDNQSIDNLHYLRDDLISMAQTEFAGERHLVFIYGSYAYGTQGIHSDLDLVMIAEHAEATRIERMVEGAIYLHTRYGLVLDEEVPFNRKLVATWADVNAAIQGQGFRHEAGRLVAAPIQKTAEFLESDEIRLRLLLNALTGHCLLISGDQQVLDSLQHRARTNWVRILPLLLNIHKFTVESFVEHLIGTGDLKGEWFLGFKDDPIIRAYLRQIFSNTLAFCEMQGWLNRSGHTYSIADYTWMEELVN